MDDNDFEFGIILFEPELQVLLEGFVMVLAGKDDGDALPVGPGRDGRVFGDRAVDFPMEKECPQCGYQKECQ